MRHTRPGVNGKKAAFQAKRQQQAGQDARNRSGKACRDGGGKSGKQGIQADKQAPGRSGIPARRRQDSLRAQIFVFVAHQPLRLEAGQQAQANGRGGEHGKHARGQDTDLLACHIPPAHSPPHKIGALLRVTYSD